jgi:hypothetical protein
MSASVASNVVRIPGTDYLMGTGKPAAGGPTSKEYVNQFFVLPPRNVVK